MRYFKNLVWFGVGFLLSVVAVLSYAETISATPPGTYAASKQYRLYGLTAWNDTAAAACSANNSTGNGTCSFHSNVSSVEFKCVCSGGSIGTFYPTGSVNYVCPSGGIVSGTTCSGGPYTCPSGQGWTLSGSTCSRPDCADGEIRQSDGSCRNVCASLAGTTNSVLTGASVCGKGSIPDSQCLSGCEIGIGGLGIEMGGSWCAQIGRYTGRSCVEAGDISPVPAESPTSDGKIDPEGEKLPPDSPEKKCVDSGKGFGSVNGVVICIDPDTTTGKKEETIKNKNPQGETTSESTQKTETKTVKNPDGSTTTITTVTNPDGSTTETTKTTSGSANGGGGNGDGDFGWGEPGEEGGLNEKEAGVSSLTPVEIAGGASCPPPVSLPHGWGEVRYDLACSLADKIRPIVLAFAWLFAGLIVIGGVKGD